jgi:nitronate monooxygenase
MSAKPAFALRLPMVAAPMFLISGPELVIAACRAGIIGSFPSHNARPAAQLEVWMDRIVSALAETRRDDPGRIVGPWSVNLVTHRTNTRLAEDLALVARFKPPIVVTALGGPAPALDIVHGYGGMVIADVANLAYARKALQAGADGLACIAAGAGGHTGNLSPFAFTRAVRRFFDGPLIIGGGIADGHGLAGAIAAGADFAYVGTRFIAARESLAPEGFKQMLVDCGSADLVVSAGITGTPASWLKPSLRQQGFDPDAMPDSPDRLYDAGKDPAAMRWANLWSAGQGLDLIDAIDDVDTIVDRMEAEYNAATARLSQLARTGRR